MRDQIFGIYELDAAGTILYVRPHEDNPLMAADHSIVGRNFFEAIGISENAGWVRDHIKNFMSGQVSVESFIFGGFDENAPVKTRIIMTRGHETQDDAKCAIVIMDIKKHIF